MRYSIDEKLVEKIITYLSSKPYVEVAVLIAQLQADVKKINE